MGKEVNKGDPWEPQDMWVRVRVKAYCSGRDKSEIHGGCLVNNEGGKGTKSD